MILLAEFARFWTNHLWSASLQVAIFISFVYAISICFKHFPARYRYILWLLVLFRLAIPTSITSPLGIGQYPERFLAKGIQWVSKQQFLPPSQPPIPQKIPHEIRLETMEAAEASFENPAIPMPNAGTMDDSVPILWCVWLSVVLVLVLAITTRVLLFRRRIGGLRPVTNSDLVAAVHQLSRHLNIKRAVRLLEVGGIDNIQFPLVHGILKPTIIIPAGMTSGWTAGSLKPLLLHELTHIKRRDCLVNFAQIVLQVLYFYHPMVWFANWMIRREREFACDDDVVRYSSGCPNAYVRSMLRIAETAVNQRRHQLLGIAMADNFSNLGRRIRRMMNKGYRVNQQSDLLYLGVIFLSGLFCVAVSAQGPEHPAADKQLEIATKKYQNNDSDGDSGTFSAPLEPDLEGRFQTEPAYASRRLAAEDLNIPMPHQANGIDLLMTSSANPAAHLREITTSEGVGVDPGEDEPKIIPSEDKEEPYSFEEYSAYIEWLRKIEADFGLRLQPEQQLRSTIPPDYVLFETGSEYLEKDEYIKARLAFQTLINTYPDSDFASYSYIKVGDTYYDEGGTENLLKAQDQYKKFIALFPAHPQAADIQMKVISNYMNQMQVSGFSGTILWADEEIDRFLKLYPASDFSAVVRQYRDVVSGMLAALRLSKITGSVVDPAGNAITGVTISLVDKESGEVLQTASPDGQGHFEIRGVSEERNIGLRFERNGLAPYFYDGTDPYIAPLMITMHAASIERIDIRGSRRVPEDFIRKHIQTKPGQLYSKTQLESDIVTIYRSDHFDYVEIEERDGDTGKIIAFIVEEKLLIRSIEFSGNISFTESHILDAFKKNEVDLAVDRRYEQRKIRVAERVLKDLMSQHGKPQGTVHIETEIIPPGSIRLRFVLDEEGAALR